MATEHKDRKEREREREIDQAVRQLITAFNKATAGLERPFRGKNSGPNATYIIQTEFAYLIDDLQRGPWCMFPQAVQKCNAFIDEVIGEVQQVEQAENN